MSLPDFTTKVGKYLVPVVRAKHCTVVRFDGGAHGKNERGDFCFWTARLKRSRLLNGKTCRALTGRAYVFLPPGDRFDRMKHEQTKAKIASDRKAYRELWEAVLMRGDNVKHIAPATQAEVECWMASHMIDAKFADWP